MFPQNWAIRCLICLGLEHIGQPSKTCVDTLGRTAYGMHCYTQRWLDTTRSESHGLYPFFIRQTGRVWHDLGFSPRALLAASCVLYPSRGFGLRRIEISVLRTISRPISLLQSSAGEFPTPVATEGVEQACFTPVRESAQEGCCARTTWDGRTWMIVG